MLETIAPRPQNSKITWGTDSSYILMPFTIISFGNIVQPLMSLACAPLYVDKDLSNIAIDPSSRNYSIELTLENGNKVPITNGYSYEDIKLRPFPNQNMYVLVRGNFKLHVQDSTFKVGDTTFKIMDGEKFISFLKEKFLTSASREFYIVEQVSNNKVIFHTEELIKKAEEVFNKKFKNKPAEKLGKIGVIELH